MAAGVGFPPLTPDTGSRLGDAGCTGVKLASACGDLVTAAVAGGRGGAEWSGRGT